MKTLFLSQKKSGNYTITPYEDSNWNTIAKCETPKELKDAVNSLPNWSTVIKSEYSQSQLKTTSCSYNEKDALRAFGISTSKAAIDLYFKS